MTAPLLSIDDLAARLGTADEPCPISTLYGILDRLEQRHPGETFWRKIGRRRLFTDDDIARILACLSNSSLQASAKVTSITSFAAVSPGEKTPIEVSTKTSDRVAAHRFKVSLEQRLIDAPAKGAGVTFKQAADAYVLWRKPGKQDLGWIERLQADKLGAMLVSEVHHHHLVKAADRLCPTQANATRNRQIMIPSAAILHYAAEQHWCAWLRVKHFHEPQRPHKAITEAQAATLLANVPDGPKRALILWLFRQGDRISDPLRLTWEDNIHLEERLVYYHVRKSDDWLPYPLHDEVVVALANLPTDEDGKRKGKVFPWSHRWSVYKWLRPLVKSLGIPFTPHVARHSFATWHHDRGASEIELQKLGRWNHPQSVKRYTKVDVERVRTGINKIGQNVGKAVGNKS